jgi:dihydroorotate dehydrogenase
MLDFKSLALPIIRRIPPELAHQLTLSALRLPVPPLFPAYEDPFEWHGLRFRNRIGIAAGFDKNAVALKGIEALGAGFVEVGTILVEPWPGTGIRPRVKRFPNQSAIWNRLGFPSQGLSQIQQNLAGFPREARKGLVIASNIGPHPGTLKSATSVEQHLATTREQLLQLVPALHAGSDLFVVNLSSPNTPGLRHLLQAADLADQIFQPLRQAIRECDSQSGRGRSTPLVVKLPPEDADRVAWTDSSLNAVIDPILSHNLCDGFVAVNTSSRLANQMGEEAGGISGAPLRSIAVQVVRLLRGLIGPSPLIIGCGGVSGPVDAAELIDAGSNLIEVYSGLVYEGPGLISKCAGALKGRGASD